MPIGVRREVYAFVKLKAITVTYAKHLRKTLAIQVTSIKHSGHRYSVMIAQAGVKRTYRAQYSIEESDIA